LREAIHAGAALLEEADTTGLGGLLRTRASSFQDLTAAGGALDAARQEVQTALAGIPGLYLPDHSLPREGSGRVIYNLRADGSWDGSLTRAKSSPSYVPKIQDFLADMENVQWNLPRALNDSELMYRARDEGHPARPAFDAWRRQLWDVAARSNREHLFGSYLIVKCQAALNSPDAYAALARKLSDDLPRFARAMRDAAEDACVSDAPDHHAGYPARTVPKRPFHTEDELLSSDLCPNPLIGTLNDLATDICSSFGRRPDSRTLKTLARAQELWIVKVSGKVYKVYFKDKKTYPECHQRPNSRLEQEQARKAQKPAD